MVEQSLEEITARYHIQMIGDFEGVYQIAKENGYVVRDTIEKTDGGLLLHFPSSAKYAILLPNYKKYGNWGSHLDFWNLIEFKNEPKFEDILKAAKQFKINFNKPKH